MKKITSLLLALVMTFLLVACVGGVNISRGTISDDGVYRSESLSMSFTKPESWVYSTDEEIAELVNISVEMFDNEDFEKALENNAAIYDMMAKDLLTSTNVIVGYENLKKSFSSNITEEQYLDTGRSSSRAFPA